MTKFQEFEYNKYYIHHASLYGFINKQTKQLVNADEWTFKYLPYGKIEDDIPYLLRNSPVRGKKFQ